MDGQNVNSTLAMFRRSIERFECRKPECRQEVLSFLEKLIAERDELIKRQEHLPSLARLAEKTVSDADEMALRIKTEAEESGRQILEETRARAVSEAENQTRTMRATAQRELQGALKEETVRLRAQVKELSDRLYEQVLNQAEESKRRLESFQSELEKNLSSVWADPAQGAGPAGPSNAVAPDPAAKQDPKPEQVTSPVSRAESPQQIVIKSGNLDESLEVDILPPRDKQAMDGIKRYLEMQDEVGAADIIHLTDKTLIRLSLLRPFDVAERLSRLPEVEQLRTVKDGARTRIEVVLSVSSEIEKERENLNMRANRLASKIPRPAKLAS